MRFWFCVLFVLFMQSALRPAAASIEKQPDGSYLLVGPDYRAHVATNGLLDSLQVGGAEFFRIPFLYGIPNWQETGPANWKITGAKQPDTDTLQLTLANPAAPTKPLFQATYREASDGLHVILERLTDNWGGTLGWHTGDHVLAVEPLPRPGFGERRLPGNGLIYALPTAQSLVMRDMRYYFDNGKALDTFYLLDDGPYNRGVSGYTNGSEWRRELVDRRPLELTFAPVRPDTATPTEPNAPPRLRSLPTVLERGVPYTVMPDAPEGMFPVGKSALFHLQFNAPLKVPQTLTYRLLDFDDKETLRGTQTLSQENLKEGLFRFTVVPKTTGFYRMVTALVPVGRPDALPSESDADFSVYTPKPTLLNPIAVRSDPGVTGSLGLHCIRLSLDLGQFFSTRDKSPVGSPNFDWKPMDDAMNPFFGDCQKYGMTGFCQLNVRPQWTDAVTFEALIKAIAAHYKAINHRWEIENEPQDRYTPENYVIQALAPAYRGAHAADPEANVIGPAIVHFDFRWFEGFFAAHGGNFLDGVSTHCYTGHNRSWEEHGNAEMFRALRAMMNQYKVGNKPIWQTEQGFGWDNTPEMPRLFAAYVVRMYALAATVGIPDSHCYYFYTMDHGFVPSYLFGNAPNRGGSAVRIYAEQIAGMKFERELPMGKYAHAAVFTDGKQDTIVTWLDEFTATERFQLGANSTPQAADIMGRLIAVKPDKSGQITLRLDGFPRYIHLPHGAKITPLVRFPGGTNYAAAKTGAVPTASSFAGKPEDADNLNDGTWHFNDGQTNQKIWVGQAHASMPQWAAVSFTEPHKIDTIAAVTPSSNVGLAGARDFKLQVETAGEWKTVREVKNNTTEWVLYAHFKPVMATAVRLVFLDLNNGWYQADKSEYTDMAPRVYELEAYGPTNAGTRGKIGSR